MKGGDRREEGNPEGRQGRQGLLIETGPDLTAQQRAFAREYLVDLNCTQAAIRAGYSAKSANAQGWRLLANPRIAALVSELQAARERRTDVTADRVVMELARIAFGDPRRLFHADGRLKRPDELDADTAATLASIDVATIQRGEGTVEHVARIRTVDKVRALELLGRHLGLYKDKVEVALKLDPLEGLTAADLLAIRNALAQPQ